MIRRHLLPLLLALGLLAPLRAGAATIYEYHRVNTSVAWGVFTPPSWIGPPQYLVASGTPLSSTAQNAAAGRVDIFGNTPEGLVDQIAASYPGIAGSPWEGELRSLGTLDNYHFLTDGLVQTRNARDLLFDVMNTLLADLQSAHPGVVFTVSGPSGTYLDTRDYVLFGTTLDDTPAPGDQTVVFGDANVDFYRVEMTVSAPAPASVPEPGVALLLGAGLAGLGWSRRRRRADGAAGRGCRVPV